MAENNNASSGDTLEFLKLMGVGAPSAGAGNETEAHERGAVDGQSSDAPAGGAAKPLLPEVTFSDLPAVVAADQVEEPKPVVIKGGPRRVVRADGRQPETSFALGQRRFSLSSGHALFSPRRERNILRESLIGVGALLLVAAVFVAVWFAAQSSVTADKQHDVVGTSNYDGSLSLTPADDGGYYTAFLVTSTPTDEEQIGTLSQVVLYRTDKDVTSVTRVHVPVNLYVAATGSSSEAHTLSQLLEAQSITRVLAGIEKGLNTRLYNVVCCQQSVFDELAGIMTGATDPATVEPSKLLGRVRSNLSLEGIVEYCGKVGDLDQGTIRDVTVPTTNLDVNGTSMAQATPSAYLGALSLSASLPANAQYDANGYLLGTQYDEAGNALLDENGVPQGALRDEAGNLLFDESGNLQFYGQQYDEHGWPVGTLADENGNPLLDERGNPLGTVYDENGNFVYDWRGNMVIQNG